MKNTMKYKLCFLFMAASFFAGSQVAISKKHMGGFKETREPELEAFEIISVEQAKNAKDDTFVVLQGYVDKSLGDERYLFRDETGTIQIEIEDKKFRGLTVYPDDFVQISGEVDKGLFSTTEIEVKNISKLKSAKD
ncbi:MAG: YgiW/YdeI family stress tolerance OB fold protein [Alphaproteobacteria bacterium]|nr:YgiW/YdeI family stress tolerance OB fold protein [Alphaproteobacteria bacterium]